MHGGGAPQVQAAARRRRVEQEASELLARLEVEPVENPLEALQLLAGQVVAWKDALAEQVNALTELRYTATPGSGGEQLRAEVALFERAMDRCGMVLLGIARLNLDDRLVRISERQAAALIRAFDVGLAAAGVSGVAAERARHAVARELRAVES